MQGPVGNDGNFCPGFCPMTCAPGDMICPGAIDPNGCPTAETCMPSKGPVGLDGNDCPVHCPTVCPADHMHCAGGMDANGCMMPVTCVMMEGLLETMEIS